MVECMAPSMLLCKFDNSVYFGHTQIRFQMKLYNVVVRNVLALISKVCTILGTLHSTVHHTCQAVPHHTYTLITAQVLLIRVPMDNRCACRVALLGIQGPPQP